MIKKLRLTIDEFILLLQSIIFVFIIVTIYSTRNFSLFFAFRMGLNSVNFGLAWLAPAFIAILVVFLLKVQILTVKYFKKTLDKETEILQIKNLLKISCLFIRKGFFVAIFFISILTLLGAIAISADTSANSNRLISIDFKAFGGIHPMIAFHAIKNSTNEILDSLSSIIIESYLGISFLIGVLFLFSFSSNKKVFAKFIISSTLVATLSLPFWIKYPSINPLNGYLGDYLLGSTSLSISDQTLLKQLPSYQPNEKIRKFQEETRLMQKKAPPVSTIPSMHIAWGVIILYEFLKFKNKLKFIIIPWFALSSFGTFYLGQHYFVDFIASLPIAALGIWLAEKITESEIAKKYFFTPEQQKDSQKLTKILEKEIREHYQFIKSLTIK